MRTSELALLLLTDIIVRGDREVLVIVCDDNPLPLEEGSPEVVCGASRLMKVDEGEELVIVGWDELADLKIGSILANEGELTNKVQEL